MIKELVSRFSFEYINKRCMFFILHCYLYVYVGDDDSFALPAVASKEK